VERRLGHSVSLAVAALEHAGTKVNLLDTPGSPDFVGELRAGLRAADGVLFVVSAAGGLDAVTSRLWAECESAGMPRAVVVTQLDRARADFDETVALCQRLLSDAVQPVHLPMHDDDGSVAGLLTLLDQRVVDVSAAGGSSATPTRAPRLIADLRAELVEGVIAESEDETLLDRYLAGEEVDPAVLTADLETAVARGTSTPPRGRPAGRRRRAGAADLLVDGFPSPLEHPCPPVTLPDGSPPRRCSATRTARWWPRSCAPPPTRTSAGCRGSGCFSGTLRPDTRCTCPGTARRPWQRPDHPDHDADDRIGPLTSPLGSALRRWRPARPATSAW
jgi:elongation factor G